MLDFDKLGEYEDYLVTITNSKTGEHISGLIDNDGLSYSAGASLGASAMAGAVKDAAVGGVQGFADMLGFGGLVRAVRGASYSSISSTVKAYEGSADNSFDISMHVYALEESYSDILNRVLKFTQPEITGMGLMKSHLYSTGDAARIALDYDVFKEQLIRVSIGNYFYAAGLFCTNIQHRFSKYVDEAGKPIYLELHFSFVPYRVLSAEELAGWIRR